MDGEIVPEIYLTKDEFALLTKLLKSFEPEDERERMTRDKLLEKIRRKTEIPPRVRPIVETIERILHS